LTPTSERESCGSLAGGWGLKPLPEPVLQRVEADEHGIRGQQQMLVAAALCTLPGELHRIDEHQSRRCSAANPATSANEAEWSVSVAGESRSAGAVVTNAK